MESLPNSLLSEIAVAGVVEVMFGLVDAIGFGVADGLGAAECIPSGSAAELGWGVTEELGLISGVAGLQLQAVSEIVASRKICGNSLFIISRLNFCFEL